MAESNENRTRHICANTKALHCSTVYHHITKDRKRGGSLYTHLRILSKPYRKKYGRAHGQKGRCTTEPVIEERSAVVAKKERAGDFEMDTIVDKDQKSGLLVAIERKTKYVVIRKI